MSIVVLKHISQVATLDEAYNKDGRNLTPEDIGILDDASVVHDGIKILWVGTTALLPKEFSNEKTINLKGKVLLPEIVDCHTHLVFGGNRAKEYSMRLNGADYEEIAKAGGGILNTKLGTNNATIEELYTSACTRIKRISAYGVGTIEIKSGYGLNFEREYEISCLINRLKKEFRNDVQILNTYMAAHAIPKEFKSSELYINEVVLPLMEKLSKEKMIDAVDIFHEEGYFNTEDVVTLFKKAKELRLDVKSHADEFNDNDGAALAASYDALSTDHLLMTSDKGIKALAKSDTVATLLPGTGFFLGKTQASARSFLDQGVKVAIASDYNPGSCHCDNVLLVASLAAPHYRMNITELWCSITLNAAHALGLKEQGAIRVGMKPRFSAFNCKNIDEITYSWGRNLSTSLS